jgi:aspartate kinase
MALVIQKFGGTSLAEPASRDQLAKKVASALGSGDQIVLVVSAMGRRGDPYATDTLLDLLAAFPGGADSLTSDLMASCGEVISACVIAALLNSRGIPALPMSAASAGIAAEGPFMDAAPTRIEAARIKTVIAAGKVPVITGFQGMDAQGRVLTLGRGGSDTSAVALGLALGAAFVDIYKDVPGVAKADPRLVPAAPFMDFLDYDSMFRLAHHGARVLHDKSAFIAKNGGQRMRVRSTFDDGPGTLIGPKGEGAGTPDFIGLSSAPLTSGEVKLTGVFASGKGAKGIAAARTWVAACGIRAGYLESGDPDAVTFTCSKDQATAFARGLFEILESAGS